MSDLLQQLELMIQHWDLAIDTDAARMDAPETPDDLHTFVTGRRLGRVDCRNEVAFLLNAVRSGEVPCRDTK